MKKVSIILIISALPFFLSAQIGCDFFERTKIQVEKTQINSVESDFGPSFVSSRLWYSGYAPEDLAKLAKGNMKGVFYDLFSYPIDENGNITGSKNTEVKDISAGYHAGPVAYCPATKELFITLSNYKNPEIKNVVFKVADIRLRIVIAKEVNGKWTVVEELPFNSPEYSVAHPAVSMSGDTLYFTSDIPDKGQGGTDIYMSIRKNGKWGDPLNLGEKVNTRGNEMFPSLFKNKMLIFSSNGRKSGAEDLDIYYTCFNGTSYSETKSLDKLNSESDDFGLVIDKNEKVGYFTSNKAGGNGDDDIYKVTFEKGEYNLELLVRDKKSMQPVPFVSVNFSDGKKLTTNGQGVITRSLDYDTDYKATSEIEGYMNGTVSFSTKGLAFGVTKQVIDVEKVEVGQKFVLENIFYDYDKWDILPASAIELDKLVQIMKDNPKWKVELGSHTDCRGSDEYNEKLSQKRSDSAVAYIVSKGISKDRIIAKGYGESQLVNKCDDGVKCTEAEHRMNRRTEFKILETGN